MATVHNVDGNIYLELTKWVQPDFIIKHKSLRYDQNYDYSCMYFCIKENLVLIQETNAEWEGTSWSPYFTSIKIEANRLYMLDRVKGWMLNMEATKLYAEILAEKELLND